MQIETRCSVHGSSNANRDTLFSPRILQCKSSHTVQSTDLPMQIETHCSVHGSSNANRETLFSPRILQCKSSHTVQSTDLPMQIETRWSPRIFWCKSGHAVQSTDPPMQIKPHCAVHGSSDANRDKLLSPRIFWCKSGQAVQSTDPPMQIKPHCSLYGSSDANQYTLFSPRTLKCMIFNNFPPLLFTADILGHSKWLKKLWQTSTHSDISRHNRQSQEMALRVNCVRDIRHIMFFPVRIFVNASMWSTDKDFLFPCAMLWRTNSVPASLLMSGPG